MIIGIISQFLIAQNESEAAALDDFSNTADDWGSSITTGEEQGIDLQDTGAIILCTLPSGEQKNMTPQECVNAGGVFDGMELLDELNNINDMINDTNSELGGINSDDIVDCLLPDGTLEQMSLKECNDAGGTSVIQNGLNQLEIDRDNIIYELGKISNFQLDENIITSLIYPNKDITVEKAVKRKGKRYGFYQSYRRIKNEN